MYVCAHVCVHGYINSKFSYNSTIYRHDGIYSYKIASSTIDEVSPSI